MIFFAVFNLIAVFILIRVKDKTLKGALEKYGIVKITGSQVVLAVFTIGILWLLQYYGVKLWWAVNPRQLTSIATAQQESYVNTFLISRLFVVVSAGIVEEVLFRGWLQNKIGITLSSALFAVLHFQYGFGIGMLLPFVASLIFGMLAKKTNVSTTILAHSGYNFIITAF